MTNSFIDYLSTVMLGIEPRNIWDVFCEKDFNEQTIFIEGYAEWAFDAAKQDTETHNVAGHINYTPTYSSFNDWKNEQQ